LEKKRSRKCRKCGERMSAYQCRCIRCMSYDPLLMTVFVGGFVVGNAALGILLAKLFSEL